MLTPQIHPYFDRLIKPLLERQALEIDDPETEALDEEIDEVRPLLRRAL